MKASNVERSVPAPYQVLLSTNRGVVSHSEPAPERKVAILGAVGGIGQPISLLMRLNPFVSRLALYDIAGTPGVAAQVSHMSTRSETTPRENLLDEDIKALMKQILDGTEVEAKAGKDSDSFSYTFNGISPRSNSSNEHIKALRKRTQDGGTEEVEEAAKGWSLQLHFQQSMHGPHSLMLEGGLMEYQMLKNVRLYNQPTELPFFAPNMS